MKYHVKTFKRIRVEKTNCFFFSVWYLFNKSGKLRAEFDKRLCFWLFYIDKGWYEIHLEQDNRKTERWRPFLSGFIKIYYQYKLRV